ncbi:hypothetical protein LUZ60_000196 [Juncus effusus]|nr:hypothetical protein LUZ60_000196 [Juncus effusus]
MVSCLETKKKRKHFHFHPNKTSMFPNPFARPIFLLRPPPPPILPPPPSKRRRSLSPPPLQPGVSTGQYRSYHRRWTNPEFKKRRLKMKMQRNWVEAQNAGSVLISKDDNFVLMSYNILGDDNCMKHTDLYRNVPLENMRWESRKRRICIEIRARDPDLLCLQEVDRVRDIMKYMQSEGYEGVHKGRNGDAKDGCAIFWKKERFNLIEDDSIDFSEFNLRHNVAQLLVFESKNSKKLIVGNIHVLFNPKRGDIKLGQIRMLLERADFLSAKYGGIPVLLAGDFNSTPSSAIYKFLTSKEIDLSVYNRLKLSGMDRTVFVPWTRKYNWTEEELRTAIGDLDSTKIKNPLKLQSSYASIKGGSLTRGPNKEPLATSYHSKFLGTVDYLWHSSELACLRVLDTLPLNLLQEMGSLPTEEIGSDHLALVAEFSFINKRTNKKDH